MSEVCRHDARRTIKVVPVAKRGEGGDLRDEVGVESGEGGLELQAPAHKVRRSGEKPDPSTGHAPAVRDRERCRCVVGDPERGERVQGRLGVDTQRTVSDIVDQQEPVVIGECGEALKFAAGGNGAIGVHRIDDHDRPCPARDPCGDRIGIQAKAVGARDRYPDRDAAHRQHRRRNVEVAGIAHENFVASVDRGHQAQRNALLRADGSDHLEMGTAHGAQESCRLVSKGLEQVGRILIQGIRAHRVAHCRHRTLGRSGETRQPAQIDPLCRIEPGRARGIDLVGVEPQNADGIAICDVVPHRVGTRLDGLQAR